MTAIELLAVVAVGFTAVMWVAGWLDTRDAQTDEEHQAWLEEHLLRALPYDVDGDNWLEVSHYVAWVESLPETDEPGVAA